MTSWSDDPEVVSDELDPSRPLATEFSAPVETDEDDPLVTELGPGYPDATRTVRVWVDEHGRVCRVRMSLRWRERVRRAADLSAMFDQALRLAQARIAETGWLPRPEVPRSEPVDLTFEGLDRRLEELLQLQERVAAAAPATLTGGGGSGHAARGRVTVELGQLGETTAVRFDEAWLERARVTEVMSSVLEAHEDAYARFVPPVMDAAEYLEVAGELGRLQAELVSMMTRHG